MADGAETIHRAEYPRRPRFFSHRFTRLVGKACLANHLGADACWLLVWVAHTEDARGYRGPVTFFNEQLLPIIGAGSVSTLDRVRRRCIVAGWLHYEPGGKSRPGTYWVLIPGEHADQDDAPTDENGSDYHPDTCAPVRNNGVDSSATVRNKADDTSAPVRKEPGEKRERSGREAGEKRERSDEHSSLALSLDLTQEEKAGGEAAPARPPNPLFDAIAEVTGFDPKTAGGEIGKATATLKKAGYDPDDVREFGRRYWEICTYAADSRTERPTPSELVKYIGRLRAAPVSRPARSPPARGDVLGRQIDHTRTFLDNGRPRDDP